MNQMSNRLMFDMNNSRKNHKKKSKPGLGIIVLVIYFLAGMVSEADPGVLVAVIAIAVLLLITFIFFKIGKKIQQNSTVSQNKQDDMCKTCSDEFVYNNRQVEYNEYSVEENFVRDRQRRLKQLDDFLKNGLIDKNEYMVLRSHYDK